MTNDLDWAAEVEALCALMDEHYLHADVAGRVNQLLRRRLAKGAYRAIADEAAFAEAVTRDTVAESGDLHLRLRHSRSRLPKESIVPDSGRDPEEAVSTGHGFARIERLRGNVGFLDIRRFWPLSMSRHAAIAVMNEIADAEALVIDLRASAGGEPEMVSFLCSYFLDGRVHLNDLYFPADDATIEWWTDPSVPGPAFGGTKPIFVLVGGSTISAAEGFAYDLQQQGRAVLIGAATAGAANFDYRYRVTDHLMFSVPSGYPVNPISGKGWEGTGVTPDKEVDSDKAFETAYRLALQHVVGATAGSALGDEAKRALGAIEPDSSS